jgi:elongation factor Ts
MITPDKIKKLRDKTGVPMMTCKKALEECGGDEEKAAEWLRKQGIKTAEKKSARGTGAGLIEAYIHAGGQVGVLIELRSETDFVAKNPDFKEIAHNIAMHIAAADPLGIKPEDISEDVIKREKEIYTEEVSGSGKPQEIVDQIISGKMDKFYKENCLLNQAYVKDPDITITDYINQAIQKFGENIEISKFERFSL